MASWGQPLNVISSYRDPEKNAAVGGAKGSQHLHGNAFDVDVAGLSHEDRLALIEMAKSTGFGGIGVYDNSLHFDIGPERAWGPSYSRDSLPEWAAGAVGAPVGALSQPQTGQQQDPAAYINALRASLEQNQQQSQQPNVLRRPQQINGMTALDPFGSYAQGQQMADFWRRG
jgi:hypothetical protein